MKYTLNFALKLEQDNSSIVYNSEGFTEKPIPISVPEIVTIFEHFIETFDEVGIIEKPNTKIPIRGENKGTKVDHKEKLSDSKSVTLDPPLKGLSGKAYICKSKELDEAILEKFYTDLIEYFQICCSKISPDNFLSEEINSDISGLREVIELRNYLAKYTKSKQKKYQDGYLYIAAM